MVPGTTAAVCVSKHGILEFGENTTDAVNMVVWWSGASDDEES